MLFRTLGIVGLSAALWGCSGGAQGSDEPARMVTLSPPGAEGSDTGSVGFQLALPSGQQVAVLSWALSGPNDRSTVVQSGTITTQSAGVTFLVGNLAPAPGYTVTLSGTASDGSVVCTGSASFAITPRTTTDVVVELACSTATHGSQVTLVNGTTFNCAAWNNVSASPTETTVGNQVMLMASANGPVPANLTYSWSAPSGSFSNSSAANSPFTCTAVGAVNVTLVVGDGPVPLGSSCNTSLDTRTIVVQCDPAMQAGGGSGSGTGSTPAPALPPWATVALGLAISAVGSIASRRRVRRAA
jgi:hypothetical protein